MLLSALVTARSSLPSPLKSPATMLVGPEPPVSIGHRGSESAVAVAQEHADGVTIVVGHGEIEPAVALEVAHDHGIGTRTSGASRSSRTQFPLPHWR